MARRAITTDFYSRLLAAFRDTPGNATAAGRKAGCDQRTAKRAWEIGWPTHTWARPIREVLRDEQVAARAQRQDRQDAAADMAAQELAKAQQEAIAARSQIGDILAGARGTAIAVLAAAGHLVPGIQKLSEHLLAALSKKDALAKLEPGDAMALLERYTRLVHKAAETSHLAMQMERLHLGLPTDILGLTDMTLEEAVREIESGYQQLETAKQRGLIVIPGGKSATPPAAADAAPAGGAAGRQTGTK